MLKDIFCPRLSQKQYQILDFEIHCGDFILTAL